MDALIEIRDAAFIFRWDWLKDRAVLSTGQTPPTEIWRGSLLPMFWIVAPSGERRAVKAVAVPEQSRLEEKGGTIAFTLADVGLGQLDYLVLERELRFTRLEIRSAGSVPALVGMYFGCEPLTAEQRATVPTLERPFWPNWQSWGFGIASAKTSPMQSFFRRWDFGHANIPLGNFGPAMGTPYAAAFPRPILAAGMGNDQGILLFGAGEVPDAAMTLQIRSSSGGLEWLYREDLWSTPGGNSRAWQHPLRLAWDATAWDAYLRYFRSFPNQAQGGHEHQRLFVGTWGDFRTGNYELRAPIDRAADELGGGILCIDDAWESFVGSGEPHPGRMPHLDADFAYARTRKLAVGIWQPTAWVKDYQRAGLTLADLLLNPDGLPIRTNWATDPHDEEKLAYCLDPSSSGAIAYLRKRTHTIMRRYRPALLKLDFAYGVPGPDVCTARDPAQRGERMGWTWLKTIADAAREIDPTVTIMGYSLHPLWDAIQNQIALDDLGDAGPYEKEGHGNWSVWAALAGDRGTGLMASSGYDWWADADVLLDTAIIGAPGWNLPRKLPDGKDVPSVLRARRQAMARWFRRATRWQPLWLDSAKGDFRGEPTPRNFGRLETIDGRACLTALALREPSARALADVALEGLTWSGSWALLAQDDASIFETTALAVVPFGSGELNVPRRRRPKSVVAVTETGELPDPTWTWDEGRVRLKATVVEGGPVLLGFLVRD